MTTPTIIQFTIHGNPIPKGRHRSGQGRHYTPQATRKWEHLCKQAAMIAMVGRGPMDGDVALSMVFYRANRRRVDSDNLKKAVMDAFNDVVWLDDSQVVVSLPIKAYDKEHPRVEVRVRELDGPLWIKSIVGAFWMKVSGWVA